MDLCLHSSWVAARVRCEKVVNGARRVNGEVWRGLRHQAGGLMCKEVRLEGTGVRLEVDKCGDGEVRCEERR